MATDPNEQDDKLWEVLGQAREPRVSPFFARNVLREARLAGERGSRWRSFRGVWKWALPAAAAVVIGLAVVRVAEEVPTGTDAKVVADLPIEKIKTSPDYEVIVELDTLLAYEKNDTWLDSN